MNFHQTQFARRDLLKGAGALVIGFNSGLFAAATVAHAAPAVRDPKVVNSWIAMNKDNTATIYFGKVELGQGNSTTILQLVAEELDMDIAQLSVAPVDTAHSMNQGATVSSSSIFQAGPQIRSAAAELRQELLRRAVLKLNVAADQLTVANGNVAGGGKTISYGALIGDENEQIPLTGKAAVKDPAKYTIVGKRLKRRDIEAKVKGSYAYMQHATMPGMLHARVVRPRGQGGYGHGPKIIAVDASSIKDLRDVRIVQQGDFLAVVAPRQWDAVRAADKLKVEWELPESLPGTAKLHDKLRGSTTNDTTMLNEGNLAQAAAAHVASGTFHGPYQAHAPFGPSCALADVKADGAIVQCSSQDVFALRDSVAGLLELQKDRVQVQYIEGAGCFGHSCYDDAALAAALISKLVAKPVRVQFMRWDEHGWDNYGPPHVGEVRIGADRDGRLVSYEYHGWHHGWMIEETSDHLATGKPVHELDKGPGSLFVNKFDAGGMYDIPNRLLVNHAVPGLQGYLKGANLRSPMDMHYSFASEQLIDRLARMSNLDPIEFRRRNIKAERWLGVLNAVAKASDWQPAPLSTSPTGGTVVRGRGVALGTHKATLGGALGGAVAEIEVDRSTGTIIVKHIYAALDCGIAINPDVVESQIVGMSIQATSRMLKEAVTFSKTNVTSLDWKSYPTLRFGQHPDVTAIIVTSKDPPLGAGEEVVPAVGAAIANAVYDAIGIQLTEYPMTPERVLAALKS